MKRKLAPRDRAGQDNWIDPCGWGGIRDALDAIMCMCYPTTVVNSTWLPNVYNIYIHTKCVFNNNVHAAEKFGGARGDTRRICDLNSLYCFQAFCSHSKLSSASFSCQGCKRHSGKHTCPHSMMECLSFAYMKSKPIRSRHPVPTLFIFCILSIEVLTNALIVDLYQASA